MIDNPTLDDWVPEACTLPTVQRPTRRAEFDVLFSQDVLSVTRTSPLELSLELTSGSDVAARAARLAAKESGCCSFFTFTLTISDGRSMLTVSTSPDHEDVLSALADRAASALN